MLDSLVVKEILNFKFVILLVARKEFFNSSIFIFICH